MTTISITSGVAVSVNVDKRGKYVQFVKNNIIITFPAEEWELLYLSTDKINNALENNKSIKIVLSLTIAIRTEELCEVKYVSFRQFSPVKFLNLDSFEWGKLVDNLPKINEKYKMDILYRGDGGEWQLVKAAVGGDRVHYKLAQRLSDYNIVVLLKSYLIVKETEKLNFGCKHNTHAKWCKNCWLKTVESNFPLCNTVDLASKLERLNNYMNWNVCIPLYSMSSPSSKQNVYKLVYRNKSDRLRCACDCVKFDLPYIYRDLFKFLHL